MSKRVKAEIVPSQIQVMLMSLSNAIASISVCNLSWIQSWSRKLRVQHTKISDLFGKGFGHRNKNDDSEAFPTFLLCTQAMISSELDFILKGAKQFRLSVSKHTYCSSVVISREVALGVQGQILFKYHCPILLQGLQDSFCFNYIPLGELSYFHRGFLHSSVISKLNLWLNWFHCVNFFMNNKNENY